MAAPDLRAFVGLCDGCDQPIATVHDSIEAHIACCAAQQARVRAELDAEWAAEPKRDRRFLSRHAPIRKNQKGCDAND